MKNTLSIRYCYRFILFLVLVKCISAQSDPISITFSYYDRPLKEVLDTLIQVYHLPIVYQDQHTEGLTIHGECRQCDPNEALTTLLKDTDLIWQKVGNQYVISKTELSKKKRQRISISGLVYDNETGEPLPYANIIIPNLNLGTSTNIDGYFHIPVVQPGNYSIRCSYIGYKQFTLILNIQSPYRLSIGLNRTVIPLNEVNVFEKVRNSQAPISVFSLGSSDIRRTATPGETDLTRALTLLPGITFNHELSSKIYIRGAGSGHTLILIDGVPVFSPGHLFGIYSSFNVNVIKNVQVIKGGFPAEYGGRSGSVIDIIHKEGNKDHIQMQGSIGLVSSNFNIEGPLKNGSYFLGVRRTYFDLPKRILSTSKQFDLRQYPDYYFYDVTAKSVMQITERDKLTFSSFYSRDFLHYANYEGRLDDNHDFDEELLLERLDSGWKNAFFSIRWQRLIAPSLQSTIQTYVSRYNTTITPTPSLMNKSFVNGINSEIFFMYRIQELGVKPEFQFTGISNHHIKFGGWVSQYSLNYNGEILYSIRPNIIKGDYLHTGVYVSDSWKAAYRLQLSVGVRANYYHRKDYKSFEPRLSIRYGVSDQLVTKAAIGGFDQFIVNASPPTFLFLTTADFWFPIDESISPSKSNQIVVGFEYDMINGYYFDVEAYSTAMDNIYELKELNRLYNFPGEILRTGVGRAYGLDVWLEKNRGSVTGWISYSYSQSERSFENIDNGKWFPVRWNRINELVSVLSFEVKKKWTINTNWRIATGQPFSAPIGYGYIFEPFMRDQSGEWGNRVHFSQRNIYRLPAYHRLDLSINRSFRFQEWDMILNFTIFNAYFHRNTVTYGEVESNGSYEYERMLPTIPSIGLEFQR